jgi:murein L,D-transpeptidase YafK
MLAIAALGAGACSTVARGTGNVDCPSSRQASVIVDTGKHSMVLCENGKQAGAFAVRIGKHGTGKSREGDGKTPLGPYGLGEPRASGAYGLFVPIEYPTPEQRKLGFTGGAVGVHGPDRRVRWLGALVNAFDTTDGCVGIATDPEMQTFAIWVRAHRVKEVMIR